MKYYNYHDYDSQEPKVISEEEILQVYWDFWKDAMIRKYGEYSDLITEDCCIEDWVVVNWAWEVK